VETCEAEFTDDRLALKAIFCVVPPKMLATLTVKKTAKEAKDSLETLRLETECVC
jgi:hypothetical protein